MQGSANGRGWGGRPPRAPSGTPCAHSRLKVNAVHGLVSTANYFGSNVVNKDNRLLSRTLWCAAAQHHAVARRAAGILGNRHNFKAVLVLPREGKSGDDRDAEAARDVMLERVDGADLEGDVVWKV